LVNGTILNFDVAITFRFANSNWQIVGESR
jgi:hypothetical protein